MIARRILPATIELMDAGMLAIVEAYLQAGFPTHAGAMLIFDIDGYAESLDAQLDEVRSVLQDFRPIEIKTARTAAEREMLWHGRRSAGGAISRISPSEYALDVTLPRSRLAEGLAGITQIAAAHGLQVAYLGHAGDGNLHPSLLCDLSQPGETQRVQHAAGQILELCARMGGSIGGEHGIGMEKRDYLPAMYAPGEIAAMLEVKQVFDPQNRLNPGKIFPPDFQGTPPVTTPLFSRGRTWRDYSPSYYPGYYPGRSCRGRALAGADTRPQGPLPTRQFIPTSPAEAAAGLRTLQAEKQPTFIAGGGSQWQGQPSGPYRPFAWTLLSTAALRGINHLSTDDLYVSVLAGTPIQEMQAALAERGFWVAAGLCAGRSHDRWSGRLRRQRPAAAAVRRPA